MKKIILGLFVVLAVAGIGYAYFSTDVTDGQCAPFSKQKENTCVQGKIYVEYISSATLDEVSTVLTQSGLSLPNETIEYWSLPRITLWDLEALEAYSTESVTADMTDRWDIRIDDEIVDHAAYFPVGKEQATLKAIITFKDGTQLDDISKYINEHSLKTYLGASLESSWYTGGEPQNWSYLDVPNDQEEYYVDLLIDDSLFEKVELYIFRRPSTF